MNFKEDVISSTKSFDQKKLISVSPFEIWDIHGGEYSPEEFEHLGTVTFKNVYYLNKKEKLLRKINEIRASDSKSIDWTIGDKPPCVECSDDYFNVSYNVVAFNQDGKAIGTILFHIVICISSDLI